VPASVQASAGALLGETAPPTGLVAFGRGIRPGVRVPRMTQLDVAPTLAALLGVRLEAASGRSLVGLLRVPFDPAAAASSPPAEALPSGR
jgi:arylsulfatase A-like enzyme